MPYSIYPKAEFWLDSPGLIAMKLGVVMLFLALAFVWTQYAVGAAWSWLQQLGTTSLLVYWVHIELVYGRWFGVAKENLSNVQCAIASIIVILAMLGLSVIAYQLDDRARGDSPALPSVPGPAPRFGRSAGRLPAKTLRNPGAKCTYRWRVYLPGGRVLTFWKSNKSRFSNEFRFCCNAKDFSKDEGFAGRWTLG